MEKKHKIEIIIVDDDICDADFILRVLTKKGLGEKSLHITDGTLLLDLFYKERASDIYSILNPKLILMDIKMPKINGLNLLATLKQSHNTKQIPIVVVSSSSEEVDVREAYDLGANGYIVKPVEYKKFIRVFGSVVDFWINNNAIANR